MVKVLQIGMTDNHGGIEEFIYMFTTNMHSNEILFDFINMSRGELIYSEQLKKMGKVINVANEFRHPVKCYNQIKKIMIENKYDVIHINKNSVSSLVVLFAAKKAGIKIRILHSHNTKSNGGIIINILHRLNKFFAIKLCNKFIACSEEAARWMFTKNVINKHEYIIINNAIDISKFIYSEEIRNKKRNELHIKSCDYVIGNVGRFVKQKNHKFLIDIFYNYYQKNKNAKLVLVGVGPLMNDIKKKVSEYKIEKSVVFLNNRQDVNELYQAFDLFILPSIYEGLGIVLIEAQTSGLPCLASSSLPKNSKVTNLIKYISLNKDVEEWVNECGIINEERDNYDNFKKIEDSGYNIKKEIQKLKKIYFSL